MKRKKRNFQAFSHTKVKPHQSIYLIHSTDGVTSAASEFADRVGFWLLLRGFPSRILWEGVGLDGAQWEPLAQRHPQGVK